MWEITQGQNILNHLLVQHHGHRVGVGKVQNLLKSSIWQSPPVFYLAILGRHRHRYTQENK